MRLDLQITAQTDSILSSTVKKVESSKYNKLIKLFTD